MKMDKNVMNKLPVEYQDLVRAFEFVRYWDQLSCTFFTDEQGYMYSVKRVKPPKIYSPEDEPKVIPVESS